VCRLEAQKLWRFRGIYHSVLNDCAILCSIFPCDQILWRGASVCGCGYLIAAGHYTTIGTASESISVLTYKFTRILLVPYQQGSTLRTGEEPVDESGEGLERTRHGASCSASSEREDEPGKSLSGPPGSLLPELPQVASLNRARTCRG
jgi:hypothetical protein